MEMQHAYRHGLQNLFDDVSSISLAIVPSLHDPGDTKTLALTI